MKEKGQVTMFIIAGVVIVAIIIAFILISNRANIPFLAKSPDINPNSYLTSCIEKDLRKNLELISLQGGHLENKLNLTYEFKDLGKIDVSYLCYQQNSYFGCINQNPLLIYTFENEIEKGISSEMQTCFDSLIKDMKDSGAEVSEKYGGFEVKIMQDKVRIKINAEINYQKQDDLKSYKEIELNFLSKSYDLVNLAEEITSQEGRFCNFESTGYMLLYPGIDITKLRTSGSELIYTLIEKETQEKFIFAIRGCVIPPVM